MFNQQKKSHKTQQPQKVVMAFGTFDLLHAGHEQFLKQAKILGDYLVVVVARDKTVRQIKGEEPLNNEHKRLQNIKKSGLADEVMLGYHDDKYKVIKKVRPDVIALGYDQMVFTQKLNKVMIDLKMNTEIIRMDAYFPQVYKSSLLKRSLEAELAPLAVEIRTSCVDNKNLHRVSPLSPLILNQTE